MLRYAHFSRNYEPLQYRQGECRLQVAVNDAGLYTVDLQPTASAPPAPVRPILAERIFIPQTDAQYLCKGNWIGWEWWINSAQNYTLHYTRNGVSSSVQIPSLPEYPVAHAVQRVITPFTHGAQAGWLIELRLVGNYISGGVRIEDLPPGTHSVQVLSPHPAQVLKRPDGFYLRYYNSDGTEYTGILDERITIVAYSHYR